MEIFGFAREMSGQTAQLVGQIQAQAEVQRQDAKQREEAQRGKFRPSVQMLKLNGPRPNRGKRLRKLRPLGGKRPNA